MTMTREEIRALRDKIGTDPILTDEEIEYIWMAMDKQSPRKPGRIICDCGAYAFYLHEYCNECGQKLDWRTK